MKSLIIVGLVVWFSACLPTEKGTIYWVNSYKVDCMGVGPMKCMLVQKGEVIAEGQWEFFYSKIEGFEYEPGFIYKLKVKEENLENVPADASSIKFTLMEVLEKKQDDAPLLNGKWDALKINGSVIKLARTRGAGIIPNIEIDIQQMQLSGIDGCNNVSGSIKSIKENTVEFGPIAVTNKMCPDMTIADSFNKAMNEVKRFRVENDKLFFLSEDGFELIEFNKGVVAKVLLNDIWIAEIIDGKAIKDKTNAPRLEVNIKKMEAMGTDGCNNFTGKIKILTNKELVFAPLASTKKACMDMTVPDKFNQALIQVKQYKIFGLNLTLLDEQGKVLMLLKKTD